MNRSQLLIVFLMFFPLLLAVDSFSVSAQQECLDLGVYECVPDSHRAGQSVGLLACGAMVEEYYFQLGLGFIIWGLEDMCFSHDCVIDCIDSSITWPYDPNTPLFYGVLGYHIYITGFTGKVLTNQSFQLTFDYFFDCVDYWGCWPLGGDLSGSFTTTGTNTSVPVKANTWGSVKSRYKGKD